MIQGLIVLFVGADAIILFVWSSRRKLAEGAVSAAAASRSPRLRPGGRAALAVGMPA